MKGTGIFSDYKRQDMKRKMAQRFSPFRHLSCGIDWTTYLIIPLYSIDLHKLLFHLIYNYLQN